MEAENDGITGLPTMREKKMPCAISRKERRRLLDLIGQVINPEQPKNKFNVQMLVERFSFTNSTFCAVMESDLP
jgi:hypothetical protein